ncbi:MAG: DUF935 family protein [Nitrospinae bacterium]|nr:DUF935 family protein [Nitrospinota bacterium]
MTTAAKPRTGEMIPFRPAASLLRSGPAGRLTPAMLAAILADLDAGHPADAMALFDEMEEKDLHLGAVTQTRFLAAAAQQRDIIPASSSADDERIAQFVRERLDALPHRHALLTGLMAAVTHGFAVAEIVWDISEGHAVPAAVHIRPQRLFTFADPAAANRVSGFPRYLEPGAPKGVELPREKFIFHRHHAASGDFLRAGLYRGVSWYYLFTSYAIKDWLTFMDLYGVPLRLGKFKPTADERARQVLKDAVLNLGSDAAAVISEDTTIEFINSALSGGHDLFQNAAEYFNRQKSKRILGQTLTTESGDKGGAYALGAVHERVREDIVAFDCRALDETLTTELIRPMVDYNFGPRRAYPRMVTRLRRAGETKERLDQIESLVRMGAQIPARIAAEAAGVTLLGDPEAPLTPAAKKETLA